MKIIIVRHGDPDYQNDCLTEQGKIEAELLSERMKKVPADYCYVSPLGRAKETAAYCLPKMGKEAEELEWLREFAESPASGKTWRGMGLVPAGLDEHALCFRL